MGSSGYSFINWLQSTFCLVPNVRALNVESLEFSHFRSVESVLSLLHLRCKGFQSGVR